MQDDRIREALDHLGEVHIKLDHPAYNVNLVSALLDDSRCLIVDIVDGARMPYPKAVNHLDAARNFINSALRLVQQGWAASEAQVMVRSAMDQLSYAQQPEDAA